MQRRPVLSALLVLIGAVVAAPRPAQAIPVFAHRYGLTCQACHTAIPHLTDFGAAFRERGYRLPGQRPRGTFPAAVKVNLAYGGDGGGGVPKAVVDEVEVLLGGAVGTRGTYFAEHYLIDGGAPGRTRDFWASWRVTPDDARIPIHLRGGQFTHDLPLDPETFRETTDHYAIWDQTAGNNPFAFFEPKIGLKATFGDEGRGLSASAAALRGHDPTSTLPARGVDRYLYVRHAGANLDLSAYRYDGTRDIDGENDRFWREGYGVGATRGRARVDAVYQRGFDTHADANGALPSSGAFVQLRYAPSPRAFALARYDATQSRARARSLIAGAGYRVAPNARLTVFDTLHTDASTGARRNSLSGALLFAY